MFNKHDHHFQIFEASKIHLVSLLMFVHMCIFSQGALYCLLGMYSGIPMASARDWEWVGQVWPALVRCGLSPTMSLEKPSIGHLLDDITDRILRQHDTIGINFTVSKVIINHQNATIT